MMTRPSKFHDAAALEEWLEYFAPAALREWEESEVAEYLDLWDWLQQEYPSTFEDFMRQFSPEEGI